MLVFVYRFVPHNFTSWLTACTGDVSLTLVGQFVLSKLHFMEAFKVKINDVYFVTEGIGCW